MFVHRSTLYFLPWSPNWDTIGKNLLPSCNGKQTIGGCTEGNSLHEKGLIKLNDFSWPPDDGGHSRRWHFSGGLTCIKQRGSNGISENSQETAKEMPFHRIGAGSYWLFHWQARQRDSVTWCVEATASDVVRRGHKVRSQRGEYQDEVARLCYNMGVLLPPASTSHCCLRHIGGRSSNCNILHWESTTTMLNDALLHQGLGCLIVFSCFSIRRVLNSKFLISRFPPFQFIRWSKASRPMTTDWSSVTAMVSFKVFKTNAKPKLAVLLGLWLMSPLDHFSKISQ